MSNDLPKYELKVVSSDSSKTSFVELYSASLNFLGKIFTPAAILLLAIVYKEDMSRVLEGLKLSKINTPIVSAEFAAEVLDGLANADPDSAERRDAIRKVETTEEVVRAEIDAGARQAIPTQAVPVSASENIKAPVREREWEPMLGISWVKPNDLFGRTYYLSAGDGLYVWPTDIDSEGKRAEFLVNTSSSARKGGNSVLSQTWIKEGGSQEFEYKGKRYKLNLVDIRNAGKIPSKAAYISVDRRVEG